MLSTSNIDQLEKTATAVRALILAATTQAGSGHPSSCLSAVDIVTSLLVGGFFHYNTSNPQQENNDHLIFSKGHAAPLLYSFWALAGAIDINEVLNLRQNNNVLEGHPTPKLPFVEAATGSLGQGLGIGFGIAYNQFHLARVPAKTYVLLGDGEFAEGSNYESLQLASYHKLSNLIGILDVNSFGQTGHTQWQHNLDKFAGVAAAFGWEPHLIDGHNWQQIATALQKANQPASQKPQLIIAQTIKGKGIDLIANKDNWHGKALSVTQLDEALHQLYQLPATSQLPDLSLPIITPANPDDRTNISSSFHTAFHDFHDKTPVFTTKLANNNTITSTKISVRQAVGQALANLGQAHSNLVVLDADVSNSTFTNLFQQQFPNRFIQSFIAEQHMVAAAVGLSSQGKQPCVATFAAFLTRAFDQIRMSSISQSNILYVGTHVGVSIGQDGPSQMGLEDIAMFRAIPNSTIVYPADQFAAENLTKLLMEKVGIKYLRATRADLPSLYHAETNFQLGGSHTWQADLPETITIVAAGITLHESLQAQQELAKQGIGARVIDLYSIAPIDQTTLHSAATNTKAILVVEDHYTNGGIADAVRAALSTVAIPIYQLAVSETPHSGQPTELLSWAKIDSNAILKKVKTISRLLAK